MLKTFFGDTRWRSFFILCAGALMIVLDTTIVNVALPSIRVDLGFSDSALAWVVNAYLLTFGGFLLLSGRLGDIYGHRRLFILGVTFFTLASLLCGVSSSQTMLIVARAIQGFGGAIASAVSLSFMMNIFVEPSERAKAMGFYGFVFAGGGSVGVFLGGLLTNLNWHWIFLVNIPVGILVVIYSFLYLPHSKAETEKHDLDILGAVTVTLSLILANYAVVNGNAAGWASLQTLSLLGGAVAVFLFFIYIESHARSPLIPLRLFLLRNIAVSNIVGVLWAAAMFAWFFLSALYMQLVLHYSALSVGLAFLPSNIIMAIFSVGLSAKIVMRFGLRAPIAFGLSCAALGLLLFSRAPESGSFLVDILPGMILLGVGAGIALNPVLLAAMSDVDQSEAGLASGLVNTSFMMGGALGLAILASLASATTSSLSASGVSTVSAINGGYHAAFLLGAFFAACAAFLGGAVLRPKHISHE